MNIDDFDRYFAAVHRCRPFPWQRRLVRQVCESGTWPEVIDLPTAAGKTAALDVALFHLALEADRPPAERRARRRIALVVDRRLVVDDAFRRAERICAALLAPSEPVLADMAERLRVIADGGDPVALVRLRGGIPREDFWTRDPRVPTFILSTVDQLGSRLLFRGYGVSEFAQPIHAGLLAEDVLLLLDEAHLSRPFLGTLGRVVRYLGHDWRETAPLRPLAAVAMTATPGDPHPVFGLDAADREALSDRLTAPKPARLVEVDGRVAFAERCVEEAKALHDALATPERPPVIGVVVNRVASARAVFEFLSEDDDSDAVLLIGRGRPLDQEALRDAWLPRMRAGRQVTDNPRPLFVVATQTIEVGADLDFDGLVSESAPLDALRQRFGRLDRLGRFRRACAVLVHDKAASGDDPVYGAALAAAWKWLWQNAERQGRGKAGTRSIDFGVAALAERLPTDTAELAALNAPAADAPTLLPAYVDLLAQTSPKPALEPDVELFLHGPRGAEAEVQLVWRADLPKHPTRKDQAVCIETVAALPPASQEAVGLPLSVVRRWLRDQPAMPLSDLDFDPRSDGEPAAGHSRLALRWRGLDGSALVGPDEIRPGDTLVVPAAYGGLDRYGWSPGRHAAVEDIAEAVARKVRGLPVLRLHPDCLAAVIGDQADELIAAEVRELLDHFATEGTDAIVSEALAMLAAWPGFPPEFIATVAELQAGRVRAVPYGRRAGNDDASGETIGGLLLRPERGARGFTDEGDESVLTVPIGLEPHCAGVGELAERMARAVGLGEALAIDLGHAGRLHDLGKADPRFQVWLYGGDRFERRRRGLLLAKSGMDRGDRAAVEAARKRAGYPKGQRHECASVQLLRAHPELLEGARDPELVEYLVGAHHGRGRPWMPVVADEGCPETRFELFGHRLRLAGSHGLERLDAGWAELFWRLCRRYGWWGLAYLEALLRLADQRRSEEEARQ